MTVTLYTKNLQQSASPNLGLYYTKLSSPLGELTIQAITKADDKQYILGIWYPDSPKLPLTFGEYVSVKVLAQQPKSTLAQAVSQLEEYFQGQRQQFDLLLLPQGTDFQHQVWQALTLIPYGKTSSYQNMAHAINHPKAVRAVGAANGKNPFSIVVPCHRVIGADGSLTGYAGGLERKSFLLELEKKHTIS